MNLGILLRCPCRHSGLLVRDPRSLFAFYDATSRYCPSTHSGLKTLPKVSKSENVTSSKITGSISPLNLEQDVNLDVVGQPGVTTAPENELTWKIRPSPNLSELSVYWLRLSKYRLTSLVVATTAAGFTMGCPEMSNNLPVMAAALIGTALTSSSAASLNQFLEIPFDSQMSRTRSRPLVVSQITPLHAFTFALVTGTTGLAILALGVNSITAILGAVNLILYSFIYTPMKRSNILNTWIGSFVGAIPPVMGYTAATGIIDPAGLLLGLILYSWQFPHFNALSWNLRHDYARAGYRMMSVTDPGLCLRTQFRHSLFLTSYCLLLSSSWTGPLTSWSFAITSLPFNVALIYLSYKFKTEPSSASSRKLFRYSLIHLPAVILLMILSKYTVT